jgi:hypothetical protein
LAADPLGWRLPLRMLWLSVSDRIEELECLFQRRQRLVVLFRCKLLRRILLELRR